SMFPSGSSALPSTTAHKSLGPGPLRLPPLIGREDSLGLRPPCATGLQKIVGELRHRSGLLPNLRNVAPCRPPRLRGLRESVRRLIQRRPKRPCVALPSRARGRQAPYLRGRQAEGATLRHEPCRIGGAQSHGRLRRGRDVRDLGACSRSWCPSP